MKIAITLHCAATQVVGSNDAIPSIPFRTSSRATTIRKRHPSSVQSPTPTNLRGAGEFIAITIATHATTPRRLPTDSDTSATTLFPAKRRITSRGRVPSHQSPTRKLNTVGITNQIAPWRIAQVPCASSCFAAWRPSTAMTIPVTAIAPSSMWR